MSRKSPGPPNLWQWVFNLCVVFLVWAAKKRDPVWPRGMDYIQIDVVLFCIVLPAILVGSLLLNLILLLK